MAAFWAMGFWVLGDLLHLMLGFSHFYRTAYFAHLGGFLSGFVVGIMMVKFGLVQRDCSSRVLNSLLWDD